MRRYAILLLILLLGFTIGYQITVWTLHHVHVYAGPSNGGIVASGYGYEVYGTPGFFEEDEPIATVLPHVFTRPTTKHADFKCTTTYGYDMSGVWHNYVMSCVRWEDE